MTADKNAKNSEADKEGQSQRWARAGVILGNDPKAIVACPSCGQANLEVKDIHSSTGGMERFLTCPACGAHNVMLFLHTE